MHPASILTPDFKSLFESAPGLYLVLTPDLKIIAVSQSYLDATMTKREEILGRGLFDVFPDNPDDPRATGVHNLQASLSRVLQNKTPDSMAVQKYDIRRPASEGGGFEVRYWSPKNSPVFNPDGQIVYIIHEVEDVTEFVRLKQAGTEQHKLTEELQARAQKMETEIYLRAQELQEANNQLRQMNDALGQREKELERLIEERKRSEERFRLLVEEVKDYAIYMLDPEGHVASWNQGAARAKGYRGEEIIGRSFECFYTSEERAKGKPAFMLKMAAAEGRYEDEGWRVRKDGTRFWADAVLTAIRDSSGKLIGFVKITRDVTKRRDHEEHIKTLNENLRRQAEDLMAANKELETFSYSVSHDLRTPLRAIDGFSRELLETQEERLDEHGKKDLGRIRAAALRMGQLIDDLLSLARITRSEFVREDVQLGALAHKVIDNLRLNDAGRQVEFTADPNLAAKGDARLVQIVLENLLGNAWKFTRARSPAKIEFGIESMNGAPVFFVRDNGAGFNMAYADKLFGVFQRLHDVKEFPGTGIGLAIVHHIIQRHGGRIWARGEENKGAAFYFTL